MKNVRLFIQKTIKNFREFKKGERGGEIINQILMLVVALLLIALILWFALVQFQKCIDMFEEMFGIDLNPPESTTLEYREFPFQSSSNNDEKEDILIKEIITINFHSKANMFEYINNFIKNFYNFLLNR